MPKRLLLSGRCDTIKKRDTKDQYEKHERTCIIVYKLWLKRRGVCYVRFVSVQSPDFYTVHRHHAIMLLLCVYENLRKSEKAHQKGGAGAVGTKDTDDAFADPTALFVQCAFGCLINLFSKSYNSATLQISSVPHIGHILPSRYPAKIFSFIVLIMMKLQREYRLKAVMLRLNVSLLRP